MQRPIRKQASACNFSSFNKIQLFEILQVLAFCVHKVTEVFIATSVCPYSSWLLGPLHNSLVSLKIFCVPGCTVEFYVTKNQVIILRVNDGYVLDFSV